MNNNISKTNNTQSRQSDEFTMRDDVIQVQLPISSYHMTLLLALEIVIRNGGEAITTHRQKSHCPLLELNSP